LNAVSPPGAVELIRPRITDHYGVYKSQADLDFAIQFVDEDIPLYVDPFLLWKSPSLQDQALHTSVVNSFNHLNFLHKRSRTKEAITTLIDLSECNEVGLGLSRSRRGVRISEDQAREIIRLFDEIDEYSRYGFTHFETIQLYVAGISKDRVSDFTCNYLKSFLIDYTMQQCEELGIPLVPVTLPVLYSYRTNSIIRDQRVHLPINPTTSSPVIFTPKRWLRYNPWISFDDFFRHHCPKDDAINPEAPDSRVRVLTYNRENYGVVSEYLEYKVRTAGDCNADPLFLQVPVTSAKRKLGSLLKLPSGKEDGADWKYEDLAGQLLASLFYPHLDFAALQSRTDSGRHIRDLIFYNNREIDFLDEICAEYGNRQLVIEMKNVARIERDHINQLNRYLYEGLGRFGVFLTRNPLPRAMFQNTIDLWSSQRKCIVALTDADLQLMVEVFESKQRKPIEVLKKNYVDFRRSCPS